MSVYKDEQRGTWYCMFRYNDWTGRQKQKCKRGFKTKREAKEYEEQFMQTTEADMNMKVGAFVEIYFRDKQGELKERSIKNKRYMIERHILPYFEQKSMNEITPADIIQWQNKMREAGYSQTYLRMLQNQMTALFTHASNIYNTKIGCLILRNFFCINYIFNNRCCNINWNCKSHALNFCISILC